MQEHEELLRAANEHKEVKNAQILLEMQQILENEANKFTQMDQSRIETTQTILNQLVYLLLTRCRLCIGHDYQNCFFSFFVLIFIPILFPMQGN